ncbi:MAG: hypothetical protein JO106_01460 [Mycobacterium sp.]|nr:hypothetical protein [Mycobacterium sp.]
MWRVTRSDTAESPCVTGYDAKHYISTLGAVVRIARNTCGVTLPDMRQITARLERA